MTSIRDPKGNLTQIAYDAKGNPLTITDALNQVTTFTYTPQRLLLTTKDALNQIMKEYRGQVGNTTAWSTNDICRLAGEAAGGAV